MVSILVIAAKGEFRSAIADRFDNAGYVPHVIDDVAAAVSMYGELGRPIVVLQMDSEHIDGLSALQSLKRIATRPKIVAVCESERDGAARLAQAAGASAVADLSRGLSAVEDLVARLIADG